MKCFKLFLAVVFVISLLIISSCSETSNPITPTTNPPNNNGNPNNPDNVFEPKPANLTPELERLLKSHSGGGRLELSGEFEGQLTAGAISTFFVSSHLQDVTKMIAAKAKFTSASSPGLDAGDVFLNDFMLNKQSFFNREGQVSGVDYFDLSVSTRVDRALEDAVTLNGETHTWQISGGSGISAFETSIVSPHEVSITSPAAGTLVSPGNDLEVLWEGGSANENNVLLFELDHGEFFEIPGGGGVRVSNVLQELLEDTDNGRFVIPAAAFEDFGGKTLTISVFRIRYGVVEHDDMDILVSAQTSDFVKIEIAD